MLPKRISSTTVSSARTKGTALMIASVIMMQSVSETCGHVSYMESSCTGGCGPGDVCRIMAQRFGSIEIITRHIARLVCLLVVPQSKMVTHFMSSWHCARLVNVKH